ncbi:hypothetical protein HDU84_000579, partial [Entophlyctis sp. JEL0112]
TSQTPEKLSLLLTLCVSTVPEIISVVCIVQTNFAALSPPSVTYAESIVASKVPLSPKTQRTWDRFLEEVKTE